MSPRQTSAGHCPAEGETCRSTIGLRELDEISALQFSPDLAKSLFLELSDAFPRQ